MKERTASAKEPAVPASGRTPHTPGIQPDHRHTRLQQLVDGRESAAAQADHTGVGAQFADQWRIRTAALGIPDGPGVCQKYVAKDASKRTKSPRLLNGS